MTVRARETGLEARLVVDDRPARVDDAFAALAASGDSTTRPILRLFRPEPAVSVGREQAIAREVRLAWCRDRGIPVVRRPTGGGALWHDAGQWAALLACDAARLGANPAERLAKGGAIVADALARLGVAAEFVAPNDLAVPGGAKIASVFLAGDERRAVLFATLLADFDVASALSALLVPTEKLTLTGLEHARERVATLADRLGAVPADAVVVEALGRAFAAGLGIAADDWHRATPIAAAAPTPASIPDVAPWDAVPRDGWETIERTARATLRLRLDRDEAGRIVDLRLATDAAWVPTELASRIAAAGEGRTVADLPAAVAASLRDDDVFVGFTSADLVRLAARAVEKGRIAEAVGLGPAATSRLMLAGPGDDARDALRRASVVLVPYCAKPAWCALRPTPDCIDCGHCAVGDAYRMARDRGLEVTTILDFEHLGDTLAAMKARGVTAYVGMCCSDFFVKRHVAFREAGMDAVLMDVMGATCYDLAEEHLAYRGAFKAEAALDLDTLEKVMGEVPAR